MVHSQDRVYLGAPCWCALFIRIMGRSYAFECPKCGLQAKVSGGPDRGILVWVQTISCRDCKRLYDAVTRLKMLDPNLSQGVDEHDASRDRVSATPPPAFNVVLLRVRPLGMRRYRWVSFKTQCPMSPIHRVEVWNDPGHCPRCGTFLEKSGLPFRLWE